MMPSRGIKVRLAAIFTPAPAAMAITGRYAFPAACKTELVTASRQTRKDDGANAVSRGAASCAESAR